MDETHSAGTGPSGPRGKWWHPSATTRTMVKFYLDVAQALSVLVAVIGVMVTYLTYMDTRYRELRKPYEEKKLALYLEAARVAAHLTAVPEASDKTQTETRFWELYWGELAFVESGDMNRAMVMVCEKHFQRDKCHQATNPSVGPAYELAHQGSREIRDEWRK